MNFSTLVSAAVLSLSLTASSFAQWSGGNWSSGGFSVGVGGSHGRVSLPNGQSIKTDNINWGVGIGAQSGSYGGYGYPSGYGYPVYNGGYAPAVVMPYYGGGCAPAVVNWYSPFTNTYGGYTPPVYYGGGCYTPQVVMPY